MEIEARSSTEYDGKHPIRVQRFTSDRDSNMTSDRAVAAMMRGRIKHVMTAADAKNQTPLLDNLIRRLHARARVLMDAPGVPIEFWEFAYRHAMLLINLEACMKHPQKHSAARQWRGPRGA